jgi:hypothetical protein
MEAHLEGNNFKYDENLFCIENFDDGALLYPNGSPCKNVGDEFHYSFEGFNYEEELIKIREKYNDIIEDLEEYFGGGNIKLDYGLINSWS